jgi:hypothetical protein
VRKIYRLAGLAASTAQNEASRQPDNDAAALRRRRMPRLLAWIINRQRERKACFLLYTINKQNTWPEQSSGKSMDKRDRISLHPACQGKAMRLCGMAPIGVHAPRGSVDCPRSNNLV